MKEQDKYWSKALEDFMEGNLDEAGLQEFKQWVAKDKDLQEALRLRQELTTFYQYQEEIAFLNTVKQTIQHTPTPNPKVIPQQLMYGLIGGVLFIILGITIWWWMGQANTLSKQLQHEIHQQALLQPFENTYSKDMTAQHPLYASISAYNSEDYNTAINEINQYLSNNKDDTQIQLYLGVSYLLVEPAQTNQAVKTLENIAQPINPSGIQEVANWYLALAYILNKEPEKAKPILETVGQTNFSYQQKQATTLLNIYQ